MSKTLNDIDPDSGSLMPLIQALIRPPDDETSNKQTNKSRHPYYRRPGRGQNNDYCFACDEGGDLLCCDRCPASFHLGCHDPPLEPEDIPVGKGQWLCRTCRLTPDGSRPATPIEAVASAEMSVAKVKLLRKRSLSRKSSVSSDASNSTKALKKEESGEKTPPGAATMGPAVVENEASAEQPQPPPPPPPAKLTPFEELIKAATIMNPKQFELPREMNQFFRFPGNDKIEPCWRNGNRRRYRKPHKLDNQGLVPLPARVCFICRKSCRKAPLIACDYCSLLFHQDCLDPPLTAMPAGLWMCPNHPEQFIDWKLVNSVSATERMKLWNRFAGPVDQETVKVEFFRKVHAKNPPFRFKTRTPLRDRAIIPPMVEWHYRNPPDLLPSLKDVLRCERVKKAHIEATQTPNLSNQEMCHMIDDELKSLEEANTKVDELIQEVDGPSASAESEAETEEPTDVKPNLETAEEKPKKRQRRRGVSKAPKIEPEEPHEPATKRIKTLVVTSADSSYIDDELAHLDLAVIKKLAFQRLQQLINGHPDLHEQYKSDQATAAVQQILKQEPQPLSTLPSQLLSRDEIDRIAQQFTSPRKVETNGIAEPAIFQTEEEKIRIITLSLERSLAATKIRSRAVLTPVNDVLAGRRWFTDPCIENSVFMRYRSLTIGAGAGNHVNLQFFGRCRNVSEKHAVIFYDEVTQEFELLNYSEFGTEVNGQLYSCDFTERKPHLPDVPTELIESNEILKRNVRDLLDRKRKITRITYGLEEGAKMAAPEPPQCDCQGRPPMIAGWEGSALLQHGTHLRFGCLSFVFAIADYDNGLSSD